MVTRALRAGPVLAVILLVAALAAPAQALGPAAPPTPEPNLIVGFDGRYVDLSLLTSLGATVTDASQSLGIAGVHVADASAFATALLAYPNIAWVETNDAIASDSAGWDGAGWHGAGWDSSEWDGAGWHESDWDETDWEGAGWHDTDSDGAGWHGAGWHQADWDGAGWHNATFDGAGWHGAGWDGAGWHGAGWHGAGWHGAGWDGRGWNRTFMTELGRTQGPSGTDPLYSWQWGHTGANVTRAATTMGSSSVVCVVDSGVDAAHPDLASRIALGGYDFANKDADASDDAGHGTHVAGIVSAATGNGRGVAGVSSARILPVKVLAADGVGQEIDLAFGIDHCRAQGAEVVSMSLGTPENSRAVHRAVVDAFAAGIVLVASAGNMGADCDCVQFPAAYPQVLSIGAITPGRTPASFSSTSHGVDFSAPGYAIVSTLPNHAYGAASGTSMSTPYASATAAILVGMGLDGQEATRTMKETARDVGPEGRDVYTGYGLVDVGAAIAAAS